EEEEEVDEEQVKRDAEVDKLRTEAVLSKVKEGLSGRGIDTDNFTKLSPFIEYGMIKGEDGSANDEKVNELVDILVGIALRTPPNSGGGKAYDPTNTGLARYLNK
ncbi:MAG: hypothetical protein PHW63_10650, partial [Alphaproteobacteria bacterium]|nr:hypothetical protein [Alphaproteobacteria bacterium]